MLNTVIIDDLDICSEVLEDLLTKHCKNVNIVKVCSSGEEGIKAISKHAPDLVISDVEMPGMTGFQMLKKIKKINFDLIFTTSFDKYAIEAIRHSAIDYLLKPVIEKELIEAIARVEQKRQSISNTQLNKLFENIENNKKVIQKIALPATDGLVFVNLKDIVHCESDSNYTTVFLSTGDKMVITKTLKEIESLLDGNEFFRIHHSHLISLIHIKKYVRGTGGYVVMSNGTSITVARERKEKFLQQFAHL